VNGRKWHNGNDWAVLTEVEHFPARQLLTRRMISFRKLGSRWRRAEELHRLHLFRRGEVHDALRQAGFSVTVARRYGAVKLLARRWAFIASKPLRPINGSS